jgi:putative membrane protein
MSEPRKPAAFKLQPDVIEKPGGQAAKPVQHRRAPVARPMAEIIEEPDAFADTSLAAVIPAAPPIQTSRWTAGKVFGAAAGLLVSLAIGVWVDALVRDLFSRSDWLGYTAVALASVAVFALFVIIAREMAGLSRLNAASRLRGKATRVIAANDANAARELIGELDTLFANVPQTARGRAHLKDTHGEIVDGADLVRLAETGLLAPLDQMARTMVLDSAKRVSVVTAVSPRALVDVGYVIYESARLIRRLAELYCGRPGTLGLFKLARRVIAHLAVTGSIAIGDSLVQQLVGHGVAARLSARLGEGVINGLMTARVGIAAMDIVRPLPFDAVKRPGIGDFLSELTRIGGKSVSEG